MIKLTLYQNIRFKEIIKKMNVKEHSLLLLLLLASIACTSVAAQTTMTGGSPSDNSTDPTAAYVPENLTTTGAAAAATDSATSGGAKTTTETDTGTADGSVTKASDENPQADDKILGMPIPVFATVVSFFGTPLVFIVLCGAVAVCKSLSCRRAADQRSGKVAPSLASESFDASASSQHEMREFPVPGGKSGNWQRQEELAEPPPMKAKRAEAADGDNNLKKLPQQQPEQKLRNPYLEQLGQMLK